MTNPEIPKKKDRSGYYEHHRGVGRVSRELTKATPLPPNKPKLPEKQPSIPRLMLEAIYASSLNGEPMTLDELTHLIYGEKLGETIELGDALKLCKKILQSSRYNWGRLNIALTIKEEGGNIFYLIEDAANVTLPPLTPIKRNRGAR